MHEQMLAVLQQRSCTPDVVQQPRSLDQISACNLVYVTPYCIHVFVAVQHVVGRLYYPTKPQSVLTRVLSPPLTWIRDWHYARGRSPHSLSPWECNVV